MSEPGPSPDACPPPEDWPAGHCPHLQRALELIGSRWTGAILLALLSGARRFSEIRAGVPGLSDRLLCERLRRLEREGLVNRAAAGEPAGAGYAPTDAARALVPMLRALAGWAEQWDGARPTPSRKPRDATRPAPAGQPAPHRRAPSRRRSTR